MSIDNDHRVGHDATRARIGVAVLDHLRDPMRRSSYALIMGTGLTSALGLVFWALAARWLPPATVGIGASLVTVMILLANLSTLGLRNGMVRFLPSAGPSTRRLVLTAYAACTGTAAVVSLVFLAGRPWWASKLDVLASPWAGAAFVLATMIWVLFVLQDHVLVGLRATGWVPIANGLCSVAKIALLPLTAALAGWAIFAATVVPAALAVLGVMVVVWRTGGRAQRDRSDGSRAEPVSVPKLVRFAVTDHLTSLLWMSATNIVMLLVLQQAGPEASAYYFLATTIGYTLYLIISNVGSALVAESARFPERSIELARQALVNAARLVIPLAIVGCLLAPVVLSFLGRSYADSATPLLRLVLLSAIPQLIIGIALSTARVRNDLRTIVAIYATIAVGDLAGVWIGLHVAGLTGVGVALLATETLVAVGLLASGRTGLWPDRRGWRALPTAVLRLGALRRRQWDRKWTREWDRKWSRREAASRLLPALAACGRPLPTTTLVVPTECDTVVVLVDDGPDAAVVKIATSAAASEGLDRHAATLGTLSTLPEGLRVLLPRILGQGTVDGLRVLVETRLPGRSSATADDRSSAAAVAALTELHRWTSARRTVDEALLTAWIDHPVELLRSQPALRRQRVGLERLRGALRHAFDGVDVHTAATHGDFWPGNVLAEDERITGLVDWENAKAAGLPDADLVHWWLSAQPAELGATVSRVLQSPDAAERLARLPMANPHLGLGDVVLLTWLWHVSDGLRRASRRGVSRIWINRNVTPVLQLFRNGNP